MKNASAVFDIINEYRLKSLLTSENTKLLKSIAAYKSIVTKYLNKEYPLEDMKLLKKYGCARDNTMIALVDFECPYFTPRIELVFSKSRLVPIYNSTFTRTLDIKILGIEKFNFRELATINFKYNSAKKKITDDTNKRFKNFYSQFKELNSVNLWNHFQDIHQCDWKFLYKEIMKTQK